ncbi:hypothetical protein RB201_04510 [Streptomyces sp. S1A(2023)]
MNRKEVLVMAYTLAMATGKGIETAEDGVATVGMTEARALLTSLIREVRYGGRVGAFTERGARQAYVVTPDFYEQAENNRLTVEALRRYIDEMPSEEHRLGLVDDIRRYKADLKAAQNIASAD